MRSTGYHTFSAFLTPAFQGLSISEPEAASGSVTLMACVKWRLNENDARRKRWPD